MTKCIVKHLLLGARTICTDTFASDRAPQQKPLQRRARSPVVIKRCYESVTSKSGTRCHRSTSTLVSRSVRNYFRSPVDLHLRSNRPIGEKGWTSEVSRAIAGNSALVGLARDDHGLQSTEAEKSEGPERATPSLRSGQRRANDAHASLVTTTFLLRRRSQRNGRRRATLSAMRGVVRGVPALLAWPSVLPESLRSGCPQGAAKASAATSSADAGGPRRSSRSKPRLPA